MSVLDLANEPYLACALDGVQLIEASAGTGKTFALATLFTRLIVEQPLRMGQVLAVTYTEAATQELRKRIRERLALAADVLGTPAHEDEGHEVALTRFILERHLAAGSETPAQLARRLRTAAEDADLAAIFTIHGFCARVLREHALEAGQGFAAAELLGNARDLHAEVAADLWRFHAADPATVDALAGLWRDPDALAEDLPALCSPLPLHPAAPAELDEERQAAVDAMRADRAAHLIQAIGLYLADARAVIATAFDAKVFDGRRARRPSFDKALDELQAGTALADWPRTDKTHLQKLLPDALLGYCKEGQEARVPRSPLFDAFGDWCEADDAWQQLQLARRAALLGRLRDEARHRLKVLKRTRGVQTYDDLIDHVADALEGPDALALVARLRAQYRIALVDEFQDTDERQWQIFARVFGDSDAVRAIGDVPALFLIGDPKQAIYGFRGGDVATYLSAKHHPATAHAPALAHNFRSRPGLLRSVQALYDGATSAGQEAFVHPGIRFQAVQPGGRQQDDDYLRDGVPAPALTLRLLRGDDRETLDAEGSREAAVAACVAHLHGVLSAAREGRALIRGERVKPGDIAVLVRNHKEATRMQQALARAGIAAVAAGRQSLFATAEAGELLALLLALLHSSDNGRLRAALSTVLLGEDARAIAALEDGSDAQRDHLARLLHWGERWQRSGPLALVSELCAEQATRLLGLLDGERRLTNYLQLGEQLQEAAARTLGLHGLIDWLKARISRADPGDETQLLRLESDALRVQIVTLHKSKGLEYPLVYLPFAGLGTHRPDTGRHRVVQDGTGRRVLQWKIDKDDAAWKAAGDASRREAIAEDARLLYVGLTRAAHALWIAAGDVKDFDKGRLAPLLAGIADLRTHVDVRIVDGPAEPPPPRLLAEQATGIAPARVARGRVAADWWVHSFTQLAHAEAGQATEAATTEADTAAADEPALAIDEIESASDAYDVRFSGSRFGNALHAALETAEFSAWSPWIPGEAAPSDEVQPLLAALRKEGYAADELEDGLALLVSLVGRTLTTGLPEGGALHSLEAHQRRAEIEFHFALHPTEVSALLALLHAHGLVEARRGFGMRRRLEGLMTGKIDLTYTRDGRWYVLDYKSNRLPRYDAPALAAAMAHSEYDLQALIYTLALHRWLRFRLGDAYDYARDFGGIRYLFCRGLDPGRQPSPGVYARRFAPGLVEALDALFAGRPQGAAA